MLIFVISFLTIESLGTGMRDSSHWKSTAYRTHTIGQIIENGSELLGKEVEIAGYAETVRGRGAICFLMLRDGTGKIQAFLKKDNMNEDVYFKSVKPNLSSILNEKRNGDNTNRGGNNSKNGGFKYVEIKKKKNRKNNRNSTNNNNNTNRNNHSTNVGVTAVNSSNVEINFDKI